MGKIEWIDMCQNLYVEVDDKTRQGRTGQDKTKTRQIPRVPIPDELIAETKESSCLYLASSSSATTIFCGGQPHFLPFEFLKFLGGGGVDG